MTETWIEAALLSSIPQDDVIAVAVQGKEIALYGGDIAAFVSPQVCDQVIARVAKLGRKGDL